MAAGEPRYDVFISHASEDKDAVAAPLAERLRRFGLRVWFDAFELRAGDSLVAKIDEGLAHSAFGILVLSPGFLGKNWPEYERQGLTAREVRDGRVVILPVWHGVGADDVAAFSPTLGQKVALSTDRLSIDELAVRLLAVIRPELAEGPLRIAAFDRLIAGRPKRVERVPIEQLRPVTERAHERLPRGVARRLQLIHLVLSDVAPLTYEEMLEDFLTDMHPERETEVWESIAVLFLQAVREYDVTSLQGQRELFALLLKGSTGALDQIDLAVSHIPQELAQVLYDGYAELAAEAYGTEPVE
ncbi:MAG TPA: toll/interleukin-1 receptor domain-containing protein [Conexibacter sp.]